MKTTVSAQFEGFPVSFEEEEDDVAAPAFVIGFVRALKNQGYTMPARQNTTSQQTYEPLKGTIVATTKHETKGYVAQVQIAGKEKLWELRFFQPSAFRNGDSVKVFKNDKGYWSMELISEDADYDSDYQSQPRPDDIPF